MSMHLDGTDLKMLAEQLLRLETLDGVHVDQVSIDNAKGQLHTVFLKRDGKKYIVRGITDKPPHKPIGTVYRGTE
jgi:hypothetical protein